jgi:hypothetical protein
VPSQSARYDSSRGTAHLTVRLSTGLSMAKNDSGDAVRPGDRAEPSRDASTAVDPRPVAALRFGFGCHVVDVFHDGSSRPVRMIANSIWSLRAAPEILWPALSGFERPKVR